MGDPAAIAAAFGGGLPPGISGTNDRCTVLVSNLNPDVSSHSFSLTVKTWPLSFRFWVQGRDTTFSFDPTVWYSPNLHIGHVLFYHFTFIPESRRG